MSYPIDYYVCIYVSMYILVITCTVARVRINRIRLPILLVVSHRPIKCLLSRSWSQEVRRSTGRIMVTACYSNQQGSKSRQNPLPGPARNREHGKPIGFKTMSSLGTNCSFHCLEYVCVFGVVIIPFVLDVRLVDAPTGVTQEEGRTGFIHLASVVLAFIFVARMIQPSLPSSTVKSNLCTHELIVLRLLGIFILGGGKIPVHACCQCFKI